MTSPHNDFQRRAESLFGFAGRLVGVIQQRQAYHAWLFKQAVIARDAFRIGEARRLQSECKRVFKEISELRRQHELTLIDAGHLLNLARPQPKFQQAAE